MSAGEDEADATRLVTYDERRGERKKVSSSALPRLSLSESRKTLGLRGGEGFFVFFCCAWASGDEISEAGAVSDDDDDDDDDDDNDDNAEAWSCCTSRLDDKG